VDPGSVLVAIEFSFSATLCSFKLDVAGYAPATRRLGRPGRRHAPPQSLKRLSGSTMVAGSDEPCPARRGRVFFDRRRHPTAPGQHTKLTASPAAARQNVGEKPLRIDPRNVVITTT